MGTRINLNDTLRQMGNTDTVETSAAFRAKTSNQVYTDKGNTAGFATKTESITFTSGSRVNSTITFPAYSEILGATAKVTTAITGPSVWHMGIGADEDAFVLSASSAVNSAVNTSDWTTAFKAARIFAPSATAVAFSAVTSDFTGGVVSLTIYYCDYTGQTS